MPRLWSFLIGILLAAGLGCTAMLDGVSFVMGAPHDLRVPDPEDSLYSFKAKTGRKLASNVGKHLRYGRESSAISNLRYMKVRAELKGWEREYRDWVAQIASEIRDVSDQIHLPPYDVAHPDEILFGLLASSPRKRLTGKDREEELRRISLDAESCRLWRALSAARGIIMRYIEAGQASGQLNEEEIAGLNASLSDLEKDGDTYPWW